MMQLNLLRKHLKRSTNYVDLAKHVVNYDRNVQLIALNLWKLYLIDTGKFKPFCVTM